MDILLVSSDGFIHITLQILDNGEQVGLKHFRPIKPLGSGDTGRFVFLLFPVSLSNFVHLKKSQSRNFLDFSVDTIPNLRKT